MKTRYIFTLITFLLLSSIYAQSNLSDYKYVIVPRQYDFLKETDKYQLNSLTKFLLEKENFNVFFNDDKFPEDLNKNRCSAIYADVKEEKSMFNTKLIVELKDCNNNIVFATREGSSKEKNYKKAYHGALRDAFQSFKTINYNYEPNQIEQEVIEVKPVEEPIVAKPVIKEVPKEELIVKQKVLKPVVEKPVVKQTTSSNILYAQAINNGFQVVDSTPKVIMIILSTPIQDVFIVKGEDAIIYKENGIWYKSKNATSAETLNIKF